MSVNGASSVSSSQLPQPFPRAEEQATTLLNNTEEIIRAFLEQAKEHHLSCGHTVCKIGVGGAPYLAAGTGVGAVGYWAWTSKEALGSFLLEKLASISPVTAFCSLIGTGVGIATAAQTKVGFTTAKWLTIGVAIVLVIAAYKTSQVAMSTFKEREASSQEEIKKLLDQAIQHLTKAFDSAAEEIKQKLKECKDLQTLAQLKKEIKQLNDSLPSFEAQILKLTPRDKSKGKSVLFKLNQAFKEVLQYKLSLTSAGRPEDHIRFLTIKAEEFEEIQLPPSAQHAADSWVKNHEWRIFPNIRSGAQAVRGLIEGGITGAAVGALAGVAGPTAINLIAPKEAIADPAANEVDADASNTGWTRMIQGAAVGALGGIVWNWKQSMRHWQTYRQEIALKQEKCRLDIKKAKEELRCFCGGINSYIQDQKKKSPEIASQASMMLSNLQILKRKINSNKLLGDPEQYTKNLENTLREIIGSSTQTRSVSATANPVSPPLPVEIAPTPVPPVLSASVTSAPVVATTPAPPPSATTASPPIAVVSAALNNAIVDETPTIEVVADIPLNAPPPLPPASAQPEEVPLPMVEAPPAPIPPLVLAARPSTIGAPSIPPSTAAIPQPVASPTVTAPPVVEVEAPSQPSVPTSPAPSTRPATRVERAVAWLKNLAQWFKAGWQAFIARLFRPKAR